MRHWSRLRKPPAVISLLNPGTQLADALWTHLDQSVQGWNPYSKPFGSSFTAATILDGARIGQILQVEFDEKRVGVRSGFRKAAGLTGQTR